jgi:hypothetical protein
MNSSSLLMSALGCGRSVVYQANGRSGTVRLTACWNRWTLCTGSTVCRKLRNHGLWIIHDQRRHGQCRWVKRIRVFKIGRGVTRRVKDRIDPAAHRKTLESIKRRRIVDVNIGSEVQFLLAPFIGSFEVNQI